MSINRSLYLLAYMPCQSIHLFKQSATSASRSRDSSWNVNFKYA